MEITAEDKEQFHKICERILHEERERIGIGTLSEKTVHAVLKNYLVPKPEYHEQKCEGYVADILYEGEIIEIQTANFNTLRRKLDVFLPKYEVTICYPIPATKWLYWIDEETGELTPKRKSSKKGTCYEVFKDVEEYRLLNGWSHDKKKGSTRYDRIPKDLVEDFQINTVKDYEKLVPSTLPEEFTSEEYRRATKLTLKRAQTALNVLTYIKTVERIGKRGRSLLYRRTWD